MSIRSTSTSTTARNTPIDTPSLDVLRAACANPLPHPDLMTLRCWAGQVVDRVLEHHATLPDQPIGLSASRAAMEALLRQPPSEAGQDFAAVLAEFDRAIAPYACRINHPRFLAFVPGAPSAVSTLGDWLCAGFNFFVGVWLEASGPSQVELVVLDWFREFLGLPSTTRGVLTSGGSEANLTALVVAREQLPPAERSRAVLYVSEQRHWSVDRAARIMGLRPDQVQPVPADADFRLTAGPLARAIASDRSAGRLPWAVVANAGATNTGVVDCLDELAGLCERERLWFHIDGAYGWSAVLTQEEGRAGGPGGDPPGLLRGIERADSITLDPHKWLAQTFEVGCVLIRNGRLLPETFGMQPEYMQDVQAQEDEINFADHGLALTRRFRALKLWLSLRVLGVGWYRRLVEHCCRLAELSQSLLERLPDFEMLSSRRLSILCFRYAPDGWRGRPAALDQLNLDLVDAVRASGRAFLSSTRLRGQVALRFCFVNWRTTAADVEEVLGLLEALGRRLCAENS